jgi:hypothetical protein
MNNKQSIARKELSRELIIKDNNIEIVKYEYKKFDFDKDIRILIEEVVCDNNLDEYVGLGFDYDGDVSYIDVNDFIEHLESRIEDIREEYVNDKEMEEDSGDYENYTKIIKYLEQYKGFNVWL